MSYAIKVMCLSVVLVAAPLSAQTDPHASHHPDDKTTTSTTTDTVKPNCPMMGSQAPAANAQHQGAPAVQSAQGGGMMVGAMSLDMMKACMSKPAASSADHQHGN